MNVQKSYLSERNICMRRINLRSLVLENKTAVEPASPRQSRTPARPFFQPIAAHLHFPRYKISLALQLSNFSLTLERKANQNQAPVCTRTRLGDSKATSFACKCSLAKTTSSCFQHSPQPLSSRDTNNATSNRSKWLCVRCASRRRESNGDVITRSVSTQSPNGIRKQACLI